jgi:hypothetical protein
MDDSKVSEISALSLKVSFIDIIQQTRMFYSIQSEAHEVEVEIELVSNGEIIVENR